MPELTPLSGGWCGNERVTGRPGPFSDDMIGQAVAGVQAIGQELAGLGYWGVFGLDYLIDLDSGELFLGEEPVEQAQLGAQLDQRTAQDKEKTIFVRGDKGVDYARLMEVMDALRGAGYLKIGLVGLETAGRP